MNRPNALVEVDAGSVEMVSQSLFLGAWQHVLVTKTRPSCRRSGANSADLWDLHQTRHSRGPDGLPDRGLADVAE
jgi:hypothetical protein